MFSWSYRALSPAAASMFRLLGLHTGQDVSVEAAASLSGVPAGQARVLLAELTRAHLLTEHQPGRHASHDLLRAYAAEQAHAVEDEEARSAALGRYLDHYLHTAYVAATLIEPSFTPVELAPPRPGVVVGAFESAPDALSWFLAERGTLLAAVRLAAAEGFSTHTWRLAWTLTAFLLRRGLWSDQADDGSASLHSARRAGDAAGEAHALLRLAASAPGRAATMKPSAPFSITALAPIRRMRVE